MYFYMAVDSATGKCTPIALMARKKGKAAAGHISNYEFGLHFHSAVIRTDDLNKFFAAKRRSGIPKNEWPAKIKMAVAKNKLNTMGAIEYSALAVKNIVKSLSTAVSAMLATAKYEYDNNIFIRPDLDWAQISTVINALTVAIVEDNCVTMAEIIRRNYRMINKIINNRAPGLSGWYFADNDYYDYGDTPIVNHKNKSFNAELEERFRETETMTAQATSFGFGKMARANSEETGENLDPTGNGVFIPTPDETYIISDQVANLFKILQIARRNCPQNVRLLGPHGCGKTELAIQFAARAQMPLLIMDCANLREARDWFGYKSAKDGTVFWHESQFVRAVTAGNHVILLDELNRANPNLLNTLMPLLDARRFTYLEEKGSTICVGPGTVFFASMNEGAGYTGTSALDRAIRDRFPRVIEMSYLAPDDETNLLMRRTGVDHPTATRLVGMANKIREDAVGLAAGLTDSLSTRQLIAAAEDFMVGGVDTLTFTISNHFSPDGDDESERARVQSIIQGKFGDMIAAKAAARGAVDADESDDDDEND